MKVIKNNVKGKKMKKIIVFSAATCLLAMTLNAQVVIPSANDEMTSANRSENLTKKETKERPREFSNPNASDANYQSRQSFISDFGDLPDVNWKRGDSFDEATFIKNGVSYTAFYDYDAALVGVISDKSFEDLPANARSLINKKYAGYSVEGVKFFDDNEQNETDMNLFGKQFEDEDNYFVALKKDGKEIIVQVDAEGYVYFFKALN